MPRLAVAGLALAALVAGCAIPDVRPAIAPVEPAALGLAAGSQAPAPQEAAVAPGWWRALHDPQLDALVHTALGANPTLELAMARVRRANAMLAAQKAANGPSISLDTDANVQRFPEHYIIPPPYGGSVHFIGDIEAGLSWNLDLFGRQKAAIESARASALAAGLEATAARRLLEGTIVETYLEVARAEQQIALLEESVRERTVALGLIRQRVAAQLESRIGEEQAKALLAADRVLLENARAGRVLALNALSALAGQGADYGARLQPTAITSQTTLPLPATIPADLLARRADIAAAKAGITAAAAGRQVARRAFYPNINLAALAGLQAVGLVDLFKSGSGVFGADAAIHLPIFESGRLKADLKAATADLDAAIASYNGEVVGAVREAADAVAGIAAADREKARQLEAVGSQAESVRLNRLRLKNGLLSKLDLVEATVALLNARQQESSFTMDALVARARLATALGGGFSQSEPDA